jgi:hypothetical protein
MLNYCTTEVCLAEKNEFGPLRAPTAASFNFWILMWKTEHVYRLEIMKDRQATEETADQAAKREERRRRREQQEREAQVTEQDESLWENVYQFSTFDATVAEEFGGEACVGGTQWPGRSQRYRLCVGITECGHIM